MKLLYFPFDTEMSSFIVYSSLSIFNLIIIYLGNNLIHLVRFQTLILKFFLKTSAISCFYFSQNKIIWHQVSWCRMILLTISIQISTILNQESCNVVTASLKSHNQRKRIIQAAPIAYCKFLFIAFALCINASLIHKYHCHVIALQLIAAAGALVGFNSFTVKSKDLQILQTLPRQFWQGASSLFSF